MSSSLTSLKVQGIRSFEDNAAEVLFFGKPLTIVVGRNGTGKTVGGSGPLPGSWPFTEITALYQDHGPLPRSRPLGLMHLHLIHLRRIVDETHSMPAVFYKLLETMERTEAITGTTALCQLCCYNSRMALKHAPVIAQWPFIVNYAANTVQGTFGM